MQLHERFARLVRAFRITKEHVPSCDAHDPPGTMRFVSLNDVSLQVIYRCPQCNRTAHYFVDVDNGDLKPMAK